MSGLDGSRTRVQKPIPCPSTSVVYYLFSDEQIEKPTTIAAHFDGDEYTPEELDEIKAFAEFVKSKRYYSQNN